MYVQIFPRRETWAILCNIQVTLQIMSHQRRVPLCSLTVPWGLLCVLGARITRWCLTWPSGRDVWNYSLVVTSCQSLSKSSLETLRSGESSHKSSHFPSKRCLRLCHGPHLLSYRFEPRRKAASSSPEGPPPASPRKDALSGHDEYQCRSERRSCIDHKI